MTATAAARHDCTIEHSADGRTYQAACACGWTGTERDTFERALDDYAEHASE